MANAAMEWGLQELANDECRMSNTGTSGNRQSSIVNRQSQGPTYRLKMGFPGESSAFEIAAGAGMPAKIIERARTRIGREWLDMGAKLRALDEELHKAQVARSAAELEQQRAARLRQDYDGRLREAREEARTAKERLRSEEERFLREKRREIENLVRQIKEQKASHESVVAAKQHVEQALAEAEVKAEVEAEADGEAPEELKAGDNVESHTFRRQGVVVETSENRATVAFGQIRVELALADLRLVKPAESRVESRESRVVRSRIISIPG